ncbi:MAG TPA: helix-turn-helix domain-containing protein [Caulobacter sp.]|nr:helix-turn-helix domain-containing protein [Caulobacter sp.]
MTPLEWLGFEELACRVLQVHSKRGVGRLLRVFIQHPGQTLTLDRLAALCAKTGFVSVHQVSAKSYISWLRHALHDLGLGYGVETVRGAGYRIPVTDAVRIRAFVLSELR